MARPKINRVPADAVHYGSAFTTSESHPCRFYRQRLLKHENATRIAAELESLGDPDFSLVLVQHPKPLTSVRLSKITCAQCLEWLRAHGSAWNAARAADHQDASERTLTLFPESAR
jgi:hypothetical protein